MIDSHKPLDKEFEMRSLKPFWGAVIFCLSFMIGVTATMLYSAHTTSYTFIANLSPEEKIILKKRAERNYELYESSVGCQDYSFAANCLMDAIEYMKKADSADNRVVTWESETKDIYSWAIAQHWVKAKQQYQAGKYMSALTDINMMGIYYQQLKIDTPKEVQVLREQVRTALIQ